MFLKQLEIVGFKSFAERTKIEFDRGITAIVGPNGSGKSNITEALRWVMGEQSAKSLRGGKMPDVIFSGTEKRNPMNYAEVVASFDNGDRELALDAERVVVSRRLYRNGDSEFRINGKKCRLKDITALFMDSGTGRDSLSIISQGRIEGIFNSKPEDRRAIFEEAAGVMRYKTSKNETETKLKHTQENLDRLEDIIFELSGQLAPLRVQRENALKFQELDSARGRLALSVLVENVRLALEKRAEAVAALADVSEKLSALTESQAVYAREVAEIKNKRNEAEAQFEQLQSEILSVSDLKATLERTLAVAQEQAKSAEKSSSERAARTSQLTEQEATAEQELSRALEVLSRLTAEKDKATAEIDELTAELAAFAESPEAVLAKLREDYLALVNREATLSNALTKNRADVENRMARAASEDAENAANQEKLALLKAEFSSTNSALAEASEKVTTLVKEFTRKNAADQRLAKELEAAKNAQFQALQTRQKLTAQIESLERIRANHSNLYAGVRAVMQNGALSGLVGVVSDLLTFDESYATALDVALGAASQNIITENEHDAQAAIRFLREKRLGRATFLPLTTIKPRDFRELARVKNQPGFIDLAVNLVTFAPQLTPAFSNLLGATVIVDTSEHATAIARLLNFTARIVTLDGTQINPGGSYAGGSRGKNSTTFTAAEIEKLRGQLAAADAALKSSETQVEALAAQQTQLSKELSDVRAQGEAMRLTEERLKTQAAQLAQTVADLSELVTLSTSASDASLLGKLQADNETILSALTEIAAQKTALEAQEISIQENSSAVNQLKTEKSAQLTNAKVKAQEISSDLEHTKSEQTRLAALLSELAAEKTAMSAEATDTPADTQQLRAQLTQAEEKVQELQVAQVSLRMSRDDYAAQLEDLEARNHATLEENQALRTQQTRFEFQLEQLEKTLRAQQLSLSEDFHLSYDAALAQAQPLEQLAEAEKELKKLEREIRTLGPVNLEAITQFEEVNARYALYTTQKADLDAARKLLEDNISEIDDEVKVRFKTAFDAIRESFQTTFRQMFAGGNADLILTSPDLLSAGIEIAVQPPGKKLASLSLMSGGEKALTALALLFAVLRVRTVPFVVLDEVEAALDEANVKRFGDYMNHFDSSNQFIVVTHRKGTMAASRVLYGVTMQAAGISKIVSVKFDDIPDEKTEH
ncbi:MAG: chromosome segregation protein SMC [Streptococcaceae bacterium]|jgi:chromosome segregation protein|nr:chromosome segregation protein SMC [Streptococcaceae bacterium]